MTRGQRFAVGCARLRVPVLGVALLLIVGDVVLDVFWLGVVGIVLLVVGLALYFRVGTYRGQPTTVLSPVAGRWLAMNSPATRVPSHGVHMYGQTYAIDVVHEPEHSSRPGFGWRPVMRRPDEFPAFGQPVVAPADGVVVRVHDRERDHRSRNSWPALPFLLLEGSVRELLGVGRVLGNHVVLDVGDLTFAAFAHLRRGSVRVRRGQRVVAGEQVAECGNSGNSSEPHVHAQLMDHPRVTRAAGVPMAFAQVEIDGRVTDGLPRNNQHLTA